MKTESDSIFATARGIDIALIQPLDHIGRYDCIGDN